MKRAILIVLGVIVIGFAGAFWWMFYENSPPHETSFKLEVEELRAEAASIEGDGPTGIEVETIYLGSVPRISMVTGSDWSDFTMARNSYRVVYPDTSLIIDTGADETKAQGDQWMTRYDSTAWDRMQGAMLAANFIVVTHEHCDHLGGLLQSPNWRQLLPKVRLNQAQYDHQPECTDWPEGSREGFKPLQFDHMQAVAPGVVLIRAPGHTPGSQLVYVRQADGKEFLFTGDTATAADNVRLLRPRSRYVMVTGGHSDVREVVFEETVAIKRLTDAAPELTIVPGHDDAAINELVAEGALKREFSQAE